MAEERTVGRRTRKRKHIDSEDEEPFLGFEDSAAPPPARNELHPGALQEDTQRSQPGSSKSTPAAVRRSKRNIKRSKNDEFLYY